MLNDEDILKSALAYGDQRAFRKIFDTYYPQTLGFMRQVMRTDEDAKDVAQEVFVKVWTMRAILPEIRSISSYIFRMSVNTALNFARNNKRYSGKLSMDISDNQLIEELIDTKEKELKITRIVQEMPEQRRKIFIMSRFELISNEQIASILGISKKTVENHLNLALRQLRLSGIF